MKNSLYVASGWTISFIGYVPVNPIFTIIYICKPRREALLPGYLEISLVCNKVVIILDTTYSCFATLVDIEGNYFFIGPILNGPSMALKSPPLDCHAVLHFPRAYSFQSTRRRLALLSE